MNEQRPFHSMSEDIMAESSGTRVKEEDQLSITIESCENARPRAEQSRRQQKKKQTHTSSSAQKKLSKQASLGILRPPFNFNKERILQRSGASFSGFSGEAPVTTTEEEREKAKETHGSSSYSLFRTRSGVSPAELPRSQSTRKRIERHFSETNGTARKPNGEENRVPATSANPPPNVSVNLPAGRYFDALKGPELDVLKDSEDLLLPKDKKWPFLLRFPIGCYGVSLGLGSQAVMWKVVGSTPSLSFLHGISRVANVALWLLTICAVTLITATYLMKCLRYAEAVKREYYHPVRVNFFFAPWIVGMFLALGAPPKLLTHQVTWRVWVPLMAPLVCLELKIYGQWLSGGSRRLSLVANPSSHLSVVGNFVGALLAAHVGWKEPAMFFWSVGIGHYLVLFVTLYQRLPTTHSLPKELHPVFFLFIAAPCTASVAWEAIYGRFDAMSRTVYFIALFLYTSLVVRINFFRGFRFSLAWWSYSFPMTAASIASIRYSESVRCVATKVLALALCAVSSTTVGTLLGTTLLHAMWGTLFPNDLAIAITSSKKANPPKQSKKGKAQIPLIPLSTHDLILPKT